MAEEKVPISYVFLWIGLIVFVTLILWYVFGSSPTIEQVSLGASVFGVLLTWYGLYSAKNSSKNINMIPELKQILVDIKNKLG